MMTFDTLAISSSRLSGVSPSDDSHQESYNIPITLGFLLPNYFLSIVIWNCRRMDMIPLPAAFGHVPHCANRSERPRHREVVALCSLAASR
eukprot:s227_g27.t1